MFATYLAQSGLHTSIKVYFLSISNLLSSQGQNDAYYNALTPRLEQVIRGIKRNQSHIEIGSICLPITVEIMYQIYTVLSKSPSEFHGVMLWAACCTAFFGSRRVGK